MHVTRACRSCGCTDYSACPGQCWWVELDLCSSCAVAVDVVTGDILTDDEVADGAWREPTLYLDAGSEARV